MLAHSFLIMPAVCARLFLASKQASSEHEYDLIWNFYSFESSGPGEREWFDRSIYYVTIFSSPGPPATKKSHRTSPCQWEKEKLELNAVGVCAPEISEFKWEERTDASEIERKQSLQSDSTGKCSDKETSLSLALSLRLVRKSAPRIRGSLGSNISTWPVSKWFVD